MAMIYNKTMTTKDKPGIEKRKNGRVSFSETEGLFAVVELPSAGQSPFSMRVENISVSGIKLSSNKPPPDIAINKDDALVLKEIIGTASLSFDVPVLMQVRWLQQQPGSGQTTIGCDLYPETKKDRERFINFVNGEMRWKINTSIKENNKSASPDTLSSSEALTPEQVKLEPSVDSNFIIATNWKPTILVTAMLAVAVALAAWWFQGLGAQLNRLEQAVSQISVLQPSENDRRLTAELENLADRFEKIITSLENNNGRIENINQRLESLEKMLIRQFKAQSSVIERSQIQQQPGSPVVESDTGSAPLTSANKPKPPAVKTRFHMVRRGENLFRIALRYQTTVKDLVRINHFKPGQTIYPGQKIKLP